MGHSNLLAQRSLIPAVHHTLVTNEGAYNEVVDLTFMTGVFAIEAFANKSFDELWSSWKNKPHGWINGMRIDVAV
jgi:hypothetical protein